MGYDAYHLVAKLFGRRSGPMDEMDGATGRLFLTADGRVHRRLAWAQFQRGEVVPLPQIVEDTFDEGEMDEERKWPESIPDL
jgi:hypothetical protein